MRLDPEWWIGNAQLIQPKRVMSGAVCIRNGRIKKIATKPPKQSHFLDIEGAYLAPGFVDLHVWGSVEQLSKRCAKSGTTSFLKSIEPKNLKDTLTSLSQFSAEVGQQSRCLGVHLEGPFLSKKKHGALPKKFLREPSTQELESWFKVQPKGIKLVTLAPEVTGAQKAIQQLSSKGVCVSLGHSAATGDEALCAKKAGATSITHVFNAMPKLHHRENSLLLAALLEDFVTMVIPDGHHVEKEALRLLYKVKGPKQIALVTDSVALSGWSIKKKGGAYFLKDGCMAGSALTMMQAVKNMVRWCDVPLHEAVAMASTVPAKLLGLKNIGTLSQGKQADMVVFDEKFRVLKTLVAGHWVFQR